MRLTDETDVEAQELELAVHLARLARRWVNAETRFFDAHAAFFARAFANGSFKTRRLIEE